MHRLIEYLHFDRGWELESIAILLFGLKAALFMLFFIFVYIVFDRQIFLLVLGFLAGIGVGSVSIYSTARELEDYE